MLKIKGHKRMLKESLQLGVSGGILRKEWKRDEREDKIQYIRKSG